MKRIITQLWLELNKVSVWLCGWWVLGVVVGGVGGEGFLRGGCVGVGDVVLGGVPHVFCGIVVGA